MIFEESSWADLIKTKEPYTLSSVMDVFFFGWLGKGDVIYGKKMHINDSKALTTQKVRKKGEARSYFQSFKSLGIEIRPQ